MGSRGSRGAGDIHRTEATGARQVSPINCGKRKKDGLIGEGYGYWFNSSVNNDDDDDDDDSDDDDDDDVGGDDDYDEDDDDDDDYVDDDDGIDV